MADYRCRYKPTGHNWNLCSPLIKRFNNMQVFIIHVRIRWWPPTTAVPKTIWERRSIVAYTPQIYNDINYIFIRHIRVGCFPRSLLKRFRHSNEYLPQCDRMMLFQHKYICILCLWKICLKYITRIRIKNYSKIMAKKMSFYKAVKS